jgi:flagellin-specific chaperone FliS
MSQLMSGYATNAYAAAQTQSLTPPQILLQLYDFAIAGCVARDGRKASAALVELIAALDFNYEDIAGGLYRLYDYALREVKAGRFDQPLRILRDLRETWRQALGPAALAGVGG